MSLPNEAIRRLRSPNPDEIEAAANQLLEFADSLTGQPPPELISAVIRTRGQQLETVLNLARAWSRGEMSRFALDALAATPQGRDKEQLAWLLKTVLAEQHSAEASAFVIDDSEDPQTRRWLLEGLVRLVFGGHLGWEELSPVVAYLASTPHPVLRSGLASLLVALPWRSENVSLLEPLLEDPDPEVVSAAAHTLALHPEAARTLNPRTLEHLVASDNALLRHSGKELDQARRSAQD